MTECYISYTQNENYPNPDVRERTEILREIKINHREITKSLVSICIETYRKITILFTDEYQRFEDAREKRVKITEKSH